MTGKPEVAWARSRLVGSFELAQRDSKRSAGLVYRSCCDKNVIVPGSERVNVDQNAAKLGSGKRLKNQIE